MAGSLQLRGLGKRRSSSTAASIGVTNLEYDPIHRILTGKGPPGVTLTVVVDGVNQTPTTTTDANGMFSYTFTDPIPQGAAISVSRRIASAPIAAPVPVKKIDISGTPDGATVGSAYSWGPTKEFGFGTVVWSRSGPSLPTGWSFSTTTGRFTAAGSAVTVAGTVNFGDVTATDETGSDTLTGLTATITDSNMTVSPTTLPAAQWDAAYANQVVSITGGTGPYSATGGPAGMSGTPSGSNVTINGTPT